MSMPDNLREVYGLFARLLEYPTVKPDLAARQCAQMVAPYPAQASRALTEFADFARDASLGCLEETYTGAFDLKAAFQPYVGYHLFGDTYNRSLFLVGLSERYRQHGFSIERELPDHLAVMLRFLEICPDPVMRDELIREALLPVLEKMTLPKTNEAEKDDEKTGPVDENKYWLVLNALRETLQIAAAAPEEATTG